MLLEKESPAGGKQLDRGTWLEWLQDSHRILSLTERKNVKLGWEILKADLAVLFLKIPQCNPFSFIGKYIILIFLIIMKMNFEGFSNISKEF